MRIKTLSFFVFIFATTLSVKSIAQTWYWTRQADSAREFPSYDAVDRNNNAFYTGIFIGSRVAFGNIGLANTCIQSDFLVKYTAGGSPVWARNASALTPSAYVEGMAVATDRDNDAIETGYYIDSIAFGAFHCTPSASYNTYLVKYDANGNVLWASAPSYPGSGYNQAAYVAADTNNNILVTGQFDDTAIFGSYNLSAIGIDMFLVKYDPAGHVLWATAPVLKNTSSSVYGTSVSVDDSGNSYVGGSFQDTVNFGAVELDGNISEVNVFLAKYDASGNVKWAVNIPALPGDVLPTPVAVDKSDNAYISCQFTNATLTLGSYTVTDGASPGCSNSLIAKYDHNGNVLWASCANFISSDEVCTILESSIATDRCNNVYWSGYVSDTFAMGHVYITVPGAGAHPTVPFTFVIKLDSSGNAIGGVGMANESTQYFSNGLAIDSLARVLYDGSLHTTSMILGNDTIREYLSYPTAYLSKFSIGPLIETNGNDSICPGDSIVLKITPTAGATYTWSTGATTDSIIAKPPNTTTYFVAINNSCSIDTGFLKVTVNPITALINGKDSICTGDSVLLIGSGGGTYLWSTGKTNDSIKVAPLANTTYTLTVNNGTCNKDTVFTVNVLPVPVAAITAIPANDSVCKGDSALLNGSGGATYRWSNGKTTSNIWVSPSINTTYTLYVNASACPDSTTVTINVIPATTASASASKDTICPHGTTTLTATGSGGQVSYKWNTGATASTINVTDSVTTKYIATVYGTCDSVKDTVTITVIPLSKPVITGSSSKCKGIKDTLTASGGTTYLWDNGSTSDTYITGAIEADSNITITAYNSIGCPDTGSYKIKVFPLPNVTLTDTNTCLNSPVVIYAMASGIGPFTYSWSPGGGTDSSITVPDSSRIYTVTVSNGCAVQKTIRLAPVIPSLTACCNKTIFEGDDTIMVAYGDSMKSYSWSPTVNCLNPSCDSVSVSPTVTTTYTVTGTDSLDCQTERIITIVVEVPCMNFTVPNVFTPTNSGTFGLDNMFYIKTTNLSAWSILIYDRWGKEMFKSTNPDVYWRGNTESGGIAPAGVYYYIINATCQGNSYKKDGFVQLIR